MYGYMLIGRGFLLSPQGWRLAPAYDVNPSVDKNGLALNIDTNDNSLNFELARSFAEYFHLTPSDTKAIVEQIKRTIAGWPIIAKEIGIPRIEQEMMAAAFKA